MEPTAVEGKAGIGDQYIQRLNFTWEAHAEFDAVRTTYNTIGIAEGVLARADRADDVEAAVRRRDETHGLRLRRDALKLGPVGDDDVHQGRLGRARDRRAWRHTQAEVDVCVRARVVEIEPNVRAGNCEGRPIESAFRERERNIQRSTCSQRAPSPRRERLPRFRTEV